MGEIVNEADLESLLDRDAIFRRILESYGPPPNWAREAGFVSLCRIILEQQVSLESANAHFKKLEGYLGGLDPEGLLALSDAELRACQISRQKAAYLRALAAAVTEGSLALEELANLGDDEVRQRLVAIKGIGNWTADIYLMFCLQRKDLFPAGDIAVMGAARELCRAATREEVLKRSEGWKPLRTLAAYFLWHYYLRSRNR
jgi:DNA-3-methyladenine glycosylase II